MGDRAGQPDRGAPVAHTGRTWLRRWQRKTRCRCRWCMREQLPDSRRARERRRWRTDVGLDTGGDR